VSEKILGLLRWYSEEMSALDAFEASIDEATREVRTSEPADEDQEA
jgi:hypothetical protein